VPNGQFFTNKFNMLERVQAQIYGNFKKLKKNGELKAKKDFVDQFLKH
jgi:hypothetical protein